jgi:hypothetical protein
MRISEIFGLGRQQPELDFVDIDPSRDLQLYLDPYLMATESGSWSRLAVRTIHQYFTHFFRLLREGRILDAREMFGHLHEPNETCLGMSKAAPQGRGIGRDNAEGLFESLRRSRAIATGLVTDLEDAEMFIAGIGADKISDMVTNIIRKPLVEYTKTQCAVWGIPLRPNTPTGFCWMPEQERWKALRDDMLVVEDRRLLLVPKWAVSRRQRSPKDAFHREWVLEYERNDQLKMKGALVQFRRNKTPYVTNQALIDAGASSKKDYLSEWAEKHMDVLKQFKARTTSGVSPLAHCEFLPDDLELPMICKRLVDELRAVPLGHDGATSYHRCVAAILDLVLYPALTNIHIEQPLHQNRKRIDITFDNCIDSGFFAWVADKLGFACTYLVVECKNYSEDPKNPEVDQLVSRFSDDRGRIGLLVCREIDDMKLVTRRCYDIYKDGSGLILPLADVDLIRMLEIIAAGEDRGMSGVPAHETVFRERCKQIVFNV